MEKFSVEYQNMFNYQTSGSRQISSIKSQSFTLGFLMSHKMDPLKSLLDAQRHMINKSVLDAPKLYVLQENKSACVFCSLSSALFFIGDKIAADCFKDKITPLLKANDTLKFSQEVALNHERKKGNLQCKLSYKELKDEYGYDPLLETSPYQTLIQLEYFLRGIHHCVTVVGKWVFDSNSPFALTLTKDNLDYCCINDNETKGTNSYK